MTPLGVITVTDGKFIATNTSGLIVGVFATLQAAARALPGGAP